ncbi:hypothetical protein H0H93_004239 [Arthromyces matolae]|nr:hypothetical protein H0H93_004239 [Arthromyces matolae]
MPTQPRRRGRVKKPNGWTNTPTKCKEGGCDNDVVLRLCRGIRDPEHKGYWYTVCTGKPVNHFNSWRLDLRRVQDDDPRLQTSKAKKGSQQTPEKLDSRPRIFLRIPGKSTGTSSSAVDPSQDNSDSGEEDFEIDSDSEPVTEVSLVDPFPTPASDTPPPLVPAPINPTRVIFDTKGNRKEVCNGPLCRKDQRTVRNCSTCTFSWCRPCCLAHQEQNPNAKCKTHQHTQSASSTATVTQPSTATFTAPQPPSSTTPATSLVHDRTLPLPPLHYAARQASHSAYEAQAKQKMDRMTAELSSQHIYLYFWSEAGHFQTVLQLLLLTCLQNGAKPARFDLPCPTYPHFKLESLPSPILRALHLDNDSMVEAYDPEQDEWVMHILSTPRRLSGEGLVLYRALGISCGEEMDACMRKLSPEKPSRKRANSNTAEPIRNTRPRTTQTTTQSSFKHPTTLSHPGSASSSAPLSTISSFPTFSSLRASESPPPVEEMFKKATTSSAVKSEPNDNVPIVDLTTTLSEDEDEKNPVDAPSSKRAAWPLKYVKAMADGFARMDSMSSDSRTVEERFTIAFPGYDWPKTTYYLHSKYWAASTHEERTRYIDAGYVNDGLWKKFTREVLKRYGGQAKLPNFGKGGRSYTQDASKEITPKPVELPEIKKEDSSTSKVKKETSDKFKEIIVIDD